MNFYSVIIGTELLNGRRKDAHFSFLNSQLIKRGWEHKGSFIIEDDPPLMKRIFKFIKKDPNSVMFSFGGIGATPDDYTRQVAAKVFTNNILEENKKAKKIILDKFGKDAYPHRIQMAQLPLNANLLKNIVTNVPGFYLENRFFFVPGFPSMASAMIVEALEKLYPKNKIKYRLTLTAYCSENILIDTMKKVPKSIDISSLPQINGKKRKTVISISSYNKKKVNKYFSIFIEYLSNTDIEYKLEDN